MTAYAAICSNQRPTAWAARCVTALAIGVAYWFVGHSFDQSKRLRAEGQLLADRVENQFAVQQGETTASSAIGFFLLGGVGLACWMTRSHDVSWRHPLLWLGLAYLSWCALSMLWSIEPAQSFRKLAILGLIVTAAVGIASKFELEDILWIAVLVLGGFVCLGVVAEIANGTLQPWRADFRFSGTCHPNDQGLQCALLALAAGYASWAERDRPWLRRGLLLAALAGLWFTKSRTTLVAMMAAAAMAIFLRSRGMQRWLITSAAVAGLSLLALAASFGSVAALDQTADIASMGRRENLNSLTGRLPLWTELMKAVNERPLAGHGFGAFWGERNVLKYSKIFSWHIPHGHNAYLDIVLEAGVVGLLLYVAWLLAAMTTTTLRHERSGRAAERFAVCLMAFSLVHGLTESKLPGAGSAGFLLMAVLFTIALRDSEPEAARAAYPIPASLDRGMSFVPRLISWHYVSR